MSQLIEAPIGAIDANPFRRLADYPYVERKLDALQRSIAEVGLWEGVLARHRGNRYEIAFGHHRVEAARRSGLTVLPLIARELTDEQMLQFMGRENMEDYNADFLAMFEVWEVATGWVTRDSAKNPQPLEIATLLGWVRADSDGRPRLGATAEACAAAAALMLKKKDGTGAYIAREDLRELTTTEARLICVRAQADIDGLKAMAKRTKRPLAELEGAKKVVGRAVKETARQSRAGQLAQKDLGGKVDSNSYRFAREARKPELLFAFFGKKLADRLAKMLSDDSAAEKLAEIQKALPQVTLDDDKLILRRIDSELDYLSERARVWRKRITPTEQKVTHLQLGGK